ncbi:alpha/beta hydrolase [Psychroserpens ponticola]|uniref:Alpha/beta hydrolase n=1 Tax=Psychroserpens ponticola TaxID=2932268 RepID=A0ABY7RZ41_9FLAO|nr:alpha/beta hydrolase [Psychroserpens ponticola]WCO02410.1 alpha/beta hydrolase [Psychroserpens ponticola]
MKHIIAKLIGIIINFISLFSPRTAGKMAIRLFSSPKRKRLKEVEKDFLETAFIEDLKYNDIRIMTYRWLGKRDTILLAHGWESNSFRWKELIVKLRALDYNIIALDAPAHGRSSGKRFNAVIYSECINVVAKKFNAKIIIGHSVGGMATTFFQHKYQLPTIEKLILLGSPSNFVSVFSRYVNMMGYNMRTSKSMDVIIQERFNNKPEHFNAAKFSESITAKGLLIHDKFDAIIPYSDAEDFRNFYKNAKLITTEGFGHGLKSETIDDHILAFVSN